MTSCAELSETDVTYRRLASPWTWGEARLYLVRDGSERGYVERAYPWPAPVVRMDRGPLRLRTYNSLDQLVEAGWRTDG